MIAVALDPGLDVGGIRRGYRGLGHQEGGADFAVHQGPQPLPLVLLGAVAHQHFHVAGVRRRTVEHLGGPADVAHLLGQRRVFQVAQSRAAEFVILMRRRRHEHIPQPFGPRLLLQFLDDRKHLPALAGLVLLPVDRHGGTDMRVHERLHPVEPFALTVRHIEVHGALLLVFLLEMICRHFLPAVRPPQDQTCREWRRPRHPAGRGCPARSCALTFPRLKR